MLFDALINLFKTLCIGAIAFSPLLVYKMLDDNSTANYSITQSGNNGLVVSPVEDQKNTSAETESSQNSQRPSIFANNSNLFSNTAPPPPPPPGEDAPIDNFVWLLLLIAPLIGYRKFSKKKLSNAILCLITICFLRFQNHYLC